MSEQMPLCGPYRTTKALSDGEVSVGAGLLVYFHNHSKQGPPVVLLPEANRHNRWTFQRSGLLVREQADLSTLIALKREGLYRLREHFHLRDDQVVAANALVQLGYNRHGEPIVFFPRVGEQGNHLVFSERGTKISTDVYDLLERLDIRGPHVPRKLH